MTVVNHWGKWVSDSVPVTGVVSLGSLEYICELIADGNAINISDIDRWEEFKRERIRDLFRFHCQEGKEHAARGEDVFDMPDPIPTDDDLAEWRQEFDQSDCDEPSTYLVGAWIQGDDGLYAPGELTGDQEFAAIVRCDSGVAQVVLSRWAIRAELCSPCYPGQANIGDDGEFLGYDFPDWVYGDRRQNVDAVRFHRVDNDGKFWQVIIPGVAV